MTVSMADSCTIAADVPAAATFSIFSDTACGRGVRAGVALRPGEHVATAHAFAIGVAPTHCARCLARLRSGGPACAGCGMSYCSEQCAAHDARGHSATECALLARLARASEWHTPLMRLLVRVLARMAQHAPTTADGRATAETRTADAICARVRSAPSSADLRADDVALLDACRQQMPTSQYGRVMATSHFLQRLARRALPDAPAALPADVPGVVCRVLHNGFGLRAADADGSEPVGCALFPTASFFNHACAPSCCVLREPGAPAVLRVCAARAVREGEELSISYIDLRLPRAERRALLRESYSFECACHRCRHDLPCALQLCPARSCAGRGVLVPAAEAEGAPHADGGGSAGRGVGGGCACVAGAARPQSPSQAQPEQPHQAPDAATQPEVTAEQATLRCSSCGVLRSRARAHTAAQLKRCAQPRPQQPQQAR